MKKVDVTKKYNYGKNIIHFLDIIWKQKNAGRFVTKYKNTSPLHSIYYSDFDHESNACPTKEKSIMCIACISYDIRQIFMSIIPRRQRLEPLYY